ncbi:MAG: putative DNA modification/repair radical SAM protein [Cryobacterium sp.]|nr:putative DNA modification/repair radical SAM protein [Oligoflexia bacterium]
MDLKARLAILADAAKYDASCASSGVKRKTAPGGIGNSEGMGICHSYTPDGRCVSLLKILLTNHCIYDCSYCVNRVSSAVKRAKFTVDEIVALTMDFYRRNYIEGLFLSSGVIRSSDQTMEEMVDVARKLRVEQRFGGYIHLKAVAGCSRELLEKAGLYADRLSANIELPLQSDLDLLAPAKKQVDVEKSMGEIREKILETKEHAPRFKSTPKFAPGGQSTQMIVGATASTDADILKKASQLYKGYSLKRVYYSAFSPIPHGAPILPLKSPPLIREHRLYQADWLLRFYGFKESELTTPESGNLDLNLDPKLSWAIRNRQFFPVDVNRAPKSHLLRIPGLGLKSVEKILEMRRFRALRLEDLGKMHVPLHRMKYFIQAQGGNPSIRALDSTSLRDLLSPPAEQLDLFQSATLARTGEG